MFARLCASSVKHSTELWNLSATYRTIIISTSCAGKADRPSDTAMFAQTSQGDPTETLFRFAKEVLGGTNTEANADVLEFETTHGRRS